ncbi:hypothetical protein HOLleu_44057 [Holothuria leucospilota]|uniref:Transposase domain-containing protein n=1 Tax=Holothuria leucospilota TaxID=206669 RepID=A0A9Q1B8T2_HOLLE|nr:hypothetical protein HOLleu_44057 [Holothuria leucospilota]
MAHKSLSYWTKRRRIHQAVNEHIQAIQSASSNDNVGDKDSSNCESEERVSSPSNVSDGEQCVSLPSVIPCSVASSSETDEDCSHSDSNDSAVSDNDIDLCDKLSDWAVAFNIPHVALNGLLETLREYHPGLPKDSRSVLHTARFVDVQNLAGGSYYHFGIMKGVLSKLSKYSVVPKQHVTMQINIDGLPLFKSSSLQLWPILGMVDELPQKEPFMIGVFSGTSKPSSAQEFLRPFVDELKLLEKDGFQLNGKRYDLGVSAIVCDAPARAFVKCVKGHSGYHGCDKCIQSGSWDGKMTFPECEAQLRTDLSFSEMRDEDHHLEPSPFEGTAVGMVSQFPLDYMHLVCLGVMRRLLFLWRKGPLKARLPSRMISLVSESLVSHRQCIPCEFARKTRSLHEVDRWKASELRTFLLYTGPVVLQGILSEVLYKNFLLLSVGVHILLSPFLCMDYSDYANQLLILFVKHFAELYGKDQLVYNVHGLTHLAADAKRYGPLDNVSAFPFENFLGKLKKMVRKPSNPLQQIVRRLSEMQDDRSDQEHERQIWKSHNNGPLLRGFENSQQYSYLKLKGFTIGITQADNCVLINDDICLVQNILMKNSGNYVVYQKFNKKESFFEYPIDSKSLNIFQVSRFCCELCVAHASAISQKYVHFHHRGTHIVMPIIH